MKSHKRPVHRASTFRLDSEVLKNSSQGYIAVTTHDLHIVQQLGPFRNWTGSYESVTYQHGRGRRVFRVHGLARGCARQQSTKKSTILALSLTTPRSSPTPAPLIHPVTLAVSTQAQPRCPPARHRPQPRCGESTTARTPPARGCQACEATVGAREAGGSQGRV